MNNLDIDSLKAALPPLKESVPNLKPKTSNELAGPCPWCGGQDRFVVFLDTGRFMCRQCAPKGGDVLDFHCKAEGLDLTGLADRYLDKQDRPTNQRQAQAARPANKPPKIETDRRIHVYHDSDGAPLYRKTVIKFGDGSKNAVFERFDGGQWLKGLNGRTQTLYNLPGLRTEGVVFLSESEKDADALTKLGLVATALGGAGNWKSGLAEPLAGRKVVILEHNDEAGQKCSQKAARDLVAKDCAVKIIAGPTWGQAKGADVADWLEAGGTLDKLRELVEAAESWTPPQASSPAICTEFKSITVEELLKLQLPERGFIIDPVIPEQGLVMIYGPRGLGKTWISMTLAYAAACGGPAFGTWKAPKPRKTLYIDGEMPACANQQRLASIIAGCSIEPPDASYFRIITPDLQDRSMPNLSDLEGQKAIYHPHIEDADLIIIDNLACLARNGRENESESWLPVQTWLLDLRRQGKTVIVVHHAGKNGSQRGTSSKEDVLDTVIALKKPGDYQPEQGARLEVHLEKARGIFGKEAIPFELALNMEAGRASWTCGTINKEELAERALELKNQGRSYREIAEELGINKNKVSRLLKRDQQ